MTPAQPWLMVVSDRRRLCAVSGRPLAAAGELLEAQVRAAAAAGVASFQLREPDLDGGALLVLAQRLAGAVGTSPLRLLVNERADVAAAVGAGVHLRARSMAAARLRPWLPAAAWISRAAHAVDDLPASAAVDLIVAGTVRPTASKSARTVFLGVDGLAAVAAASPVPVIGIGGLSGQDWPALRAAGAVGFAAIGAFLPRSGESIATAIGRAVGECGGVVDWTGRRS